MKDIKLKNGTVVHIPHDEAMSDYLANYKPKFLVSAEKISGTKMPDIVMKKKEKNLNDCERSC